MILFKNKKYLLILVFIFVKQGSLKCFEYETFFDWSKACFANLKEHTNAFIEAPTTSTRGLHTIKDARSIPLPTPLNNDELKEAVDLFLSMFKNQNEEIFAASVFDNNMTKHAHFFNIDAFNVAWDATRVNPQHVDEYYAPYIEKKIIEPGSKVCFIGDCHGSIHSLLRNLWRLVTLGYLNNDFTIKADNFHIIFLGDFVDRGRYGLEIWYTLLRLKLVNWDKVSLIRGNHEIKSVSTKYGYQHEVKGGNALFITNRETITDRFTGKMDQQVAYEHMTGLYRFIPAALMLGSNNHFVQCCHGGIITDRTIIIDFLNDDNKVFTAINEETSKAIQWNDFRQSDFIFEKYGFGKPRGSNFVSTSVSDYIAYRDDLNQSLNQYGKSFHAIFRGHQDQTFGFKMFFPADANGNSVIEDFARSDYESNHPNQEQPLRNGINAFAQTFKQFFHNEYNTRVGNYINGPYYWKAIVTNEDDLNNDEGFLTSNYTPIFTFTTATEARGLLHDCFGIATITDNYNEWRLKIYENEISENRENKYLTINLDEHNTSNIICNWRNVPATNPIGEELQNEIGVIQQIQVQQGDTILNQPEITQEAPIIQEIEAPEEPIIQEDATIQEQTIEGYLFRNTTNRYITLKWYYQENNYFGQPTKLNPSTTRYVTIEPYGEIVVPEIDVAGDFNSRTWHGTRHLVALQDNEKVETHNFSSQRNWIDNKSGTHYELRINMDKPENTIGRTYIISFDANEALKIAPESLEQTYIFTNNTPQRVYIRPFKQQYGYSYHTLVDGGEIIEIEPGESALMQITQDDPTIYTGEGSRHIVAADNPEALQNPDFNLTSQPRVFRINIDKRENREILNYIIEDVFTIQGTKNLSIKKPDEN